MAASCSPKNILSTYNQWQNTQSEWRHYYNVFSSKISLSSDAVSKRAWLVFSLYALQSLFFKKIWIIFKQKTRRTSNALHIDKLSMELGSLTKLLASWEVYDFHCTSHKKPDIRQWIQTQQISIDLKQYYEKKNNIYMSVLNSQFSITSCSKKTSFLLPFLIQLRT
jgi:hypothetical protein